MKTVKHKLPALIVSWLPADGVDDYYLHCKEMLSGKTTVQKVKHAQSFATISNLQKGTIYTVDVSSGIDPALSSFVQFGNVQRTFYGKLHNLSRVFPCPYAYRLS